MLPFIAGDRAPSSFTSSGSERSVSRTRFHRLGTDVLRLLYRPINRARARKEASKFKPDAVYERYALFQEVGSAVCRGSKTPWILEVNALLAIESTTDRKATTSRRFAQWFEKRTLNRANVIVCVTEELRSALYATYEIDPSRIIVIENGVDSERATPTAQQDSPFLRIGFLGSLYKWQALDTLLDALSHLRDTGAFSLDIAGEGPEYRALLELTKRLDLQEAVRFHGRVHPDDVPGFLQSIDVGYSGHRSAGGVYFSPLKLWEYLASGLPVVSSSHSTAVDLRSAGHAVTCFDGSTEDLVSVLKRMLTEKARLRECARERSAEILELYSWEARLRKLIGYLEGQAKA